MDILGIGPMELILILIVALAVFGPDKLPGIGAKLGHALRDMRKATRSFSEEISAPAKELMEPLQEVKNAAKTMGEAAAVVRNPSAAIRQTLMTELNVEPSKPAGEAPPVTPVEDAGTENRIAPPGFETAPVVTEHAVLEPAPDVELAPPVVVSPVDDLPPSAFDPAVAPEPEVSAPDASVAERPLTDAPADEVDDLLPPPAPDSDVKA